MAVGKAPDLLEPWYQFGKNMTCILQGQATDVIAAKPPKKLKHYIKLNIIHA